MIKRRFYKVEHGDDDGASDSSSSESDVEPEAEAEASSEESGDDSDTEVREASPDSPSTSAGYLSEDSSANEVSVDSEGIPIEEADSENEIPGHFVAEDREPSEKRHAGLVELDPSDLKEKDAIPEDSLAYILKCKTVFKCRICPRIVCLNEESLIAHIKSKRHIRSEKLLNEGRLKAMLNSDGEVENQETALEMHTRVMADAQANPTKKKDQKQRRKRFRKKNVEGKSGSEDVEKSKDTPAKKKVNLGSEDGKKSKDTPAKKKDKSGSEDRKNSKNTPNKKGKSGQEDSKVPKSTSAKKGKFGQEDTKKLKDTPLAKKGKSGSEDPKKSKTTPWKKKQRRE